MDLAELERVKPGVMIETECKCARSCELYKMILNPNTDTQEVQYFFKFYGIGEGEPPTHSIDPEELLELINRPKKFKEYVDNLSEEIYYQYC